MKSFGDSGMLERHKAGGSKYAIFEVSGSKNHTLYGIWDQGTLKGLLFGYFWSLHAGYLNLLGKQGHKAQTKRPCSFSHSQMVHVFPI